MGGYCHKAADDLGYAVLCPRRLPRVLDIIPCRGPAPAEKLWGKYCFDYVLDSLFSGPPGYHGPFATNRRTGHLALWTIGPKSDFNPDGLFACPGGGRREGPELVAGHSGYWWACYRNCSGERQQRPHRLPVEHRRCRPWGQRPRHHGTKQGASSRTALPGGAGGRRSLAPLPQGSGLRPPPEQPSDDGAQELSRGVTAVVEGRGIGEFYISFAPCNASPGRSDFIGGARSA
jgi:hypothetical protein